MKPVSNAIFLFIFTASVSLGQTQLTQNLSNSTVQTGFAVITPVTGSAQGLSVTEIFGERLGGNLFQSSVLPSPPVTLTGVVVTSDPNAGMDTGIAIVNPNNFPATVTLALRNDQGAAISTRTVTVGGLQQVSRFATELFAGEPAMAVSVTGLLFISSEVPVGVLGLSFNGTSFTSLPVATQLSIDNTPEDTVMAFPGSAVMAVPTVSIFTSGVSTQPLPSTIAALPSTTTQSPSTFAGLATQQPVTAITTPLGSTSFVTQPLTGVSSASITSTEQLTPTSASTAAVIAPTGTVLPLIAPDIGGNGALLLPQVAMGAGWTSKITIANTTGTAQAVRVDFFNSNGGPLTLPFGSSLPNVVIPAGGVVTISTAM